MELRVNDQTFNLKEAGEHFRLSTDAIALDIRAQLMPMELSKDDEKLDADFGIITERDASHDYYDGSYTVTPKVDAQTLKTADRVMRENVDVKAIPKFEVDNQQGTTVYIGSELQWQ